MAKRHIVELVDDLDDGPADETVSFGIDGNHYDIDLSESNAAALRDVLANYVAHARRGSRSSSRTVASGRRSTRGTRTDREQTQAMREWARTNGFKVGEKGRIPAHIIEAYNAQS